MLFAACDLGATNTQVALIDASGKISLDARRPTDVRSAKSVVEGVVALAAELLDAAGLPPNELGGFGIGVAGMVEAKTGKVVFAPNLPLRNTPLRKMLLDEFRVPVLVDNDAAMAVLGESRFGAGGGVKDMVMITVGTGIGGGILIDGKLYRGATGCAAEIGHMVLNMDGPVCKCGHKGCFESLASGRAIATRAREAIGKAGGKSLIMKLADGDIKTVSGELVAQAAAQGDKTAVGVMEETGKIIGVGLVNLVNIFNPQMVILGGGVMEGDTILLKTAMAMVKKCALIPNREAVKIVPAKLGNKAGLLGAAAMIMDSR